MEKLIATSAIFFRVMMVTAFRTMFGMQVERCSLKAFFNIFYQNSVGFTDQCSSNTYTLMLYCCYVENAYLKWLFQMIPEEKEFCLLQSKSQAACRVMIVHQLTRSESFEFKKKNPI